MKHLKEILEKMFSYVGEKYTPEYVKQDEWFLNHSWTKEQQDEFIVWLVDYLKNSEARKELMMFPIKDRKNLVMFSQHFVFNYGWKTIDMNDCSDLDTNDL